MKVNVYLIEGFHNYEKIYGEYVRDKSSGKVLFVEESISGIFINNNLNEHIITFKFGNLYKDAFKNTLKNIFKKRIKAELYSKSLMGWAHFYVCMKFDIQKVYFVDDLPRFPLLKVRTSLIEEDIFIFLFHIIYKQKFCMYSWGFYRTYGLTEGEYKVSEEIALKPIKHEYKYLILDFDPEAWGVDIDSSLPKLQLFFGSLEDVAIKLHPTSRTFLARYFDFPILDRNLPSELFVNPEVTFIYLLSEGVRKSLKTINIFKLLTFHSDSAKDQVLNEIVKYIDFAGLKNIEFIE